MVSSSRRGAGGSVPGAAGPLVSESRYFRAGFWAGFSTAPKQGTQPAFFDLLLLSERASRRLIKVLRSMVVSFVAGDGFCSHNHSSERKGNEGTRKNHGLRRCFRGRP